MKPKLVKLFLSLFIPCLIFASLLLFFTSETAVSAQTEEYHRLKYYLHPDLVADLTAEELNDRLTLYTEDLNTIFSQTNRRFLFDSVTDIIITDTQPHQTLGTPPFPTTGYEIWIHAQQSTNIVDGQPHTYGGSAEFDGPSGAGVADDLYWDAVHDRSTLIDGSRELEEYWIQIDHKLHELAHVFGAGLSEYYSLVQVNDTTGISPIQNVNAANSNDPYWNEHPDYFTDPLLWNIWNRASVGGPSSYVDLINTVHFAEVTVAIINSPCRLANVSCMPSTIPDMSAPIVRVIDALTGEPISGAQVNVWNVNSANPYLATLLTDATTDSAGEITFLWNAGPPINWFGNTSNMKLFKSFATGYQPAVTYASIFDAQERKMIYGLDEMVVTLYMWPDTVYAAPDAVTCGSWSPCYNGSTSIQDALNDVPNNSRVIVLGEHTINTSLRSGNSGANKATLDGRYGGTITWTGGSGNLFTANSGALTMVGLTLTCQNNCTNSTVFHQNGGPLLAYANNIIGFYQGYSGSSTANLRHNWWDGMDALSIGQTDAYDFRLGASVVDWDTFTLDEAKMRGLNSYGTGIVVSHGRGEAQAPFGAATSADGNSQCSDYYDYFILNGSGEWLVQVPIDTMPSGCNDVHSNGTLFRFAQTAGGAPATSCVAGACWQSLLPQPVPLFRPHNVRVRLDSAQLQGTPIVAANVDGNDPTAVSLDSFYAQSTSLMGLFALAFSLLLTSTGWWGYRRSHG